MRKDRQNNKIITNVKDYIGIDFLRTELSMVFTFYNIVRPSVLVDRVKSNTLLNYEHFTSETQER